MSLFEIRESELSVAEVIAAVTRPEAGGIAVFVGTVRSENAGLPVTRLEYQAYASMAAKEMARIGAEIALEIADARLAVLHRVGSLVVGDAAVICAASTPHRAEAFQACRLLIDRIKARVPIWKREHGPGGPYWVGWEDARCEPGGEHGHGHGHRHDQ
ncbi:MAG TPA: molybdenum cofactor biosynthesis protein MoaE [Polyangiaceae bacterium]|nr:molybdenum cofactor biosynthesis protein MoaE [Polyangiaceae bacterium]